MITYDRDSFLAGLAVGRALWLPPIIEEGFHAPLRMMAHNDDQQDTDAEETETDNNAV